MKLLLGCIADDITGATDLALMLGSHGMPVVQYNGVPQASDPAPDAAAVVVALKSRTAPVSEAVEETLAAYRWLKERGAVQFFFKYCSTFDSTDKGNIGPVAEALLDELGGTALFCPAFPVNGRSVYKGYLYVDDVLLSESGMRNHPLTPMTDSSLPRVLGRQVGGAEAVGLIEYLTVESGAGAVKKELDELGTAGKRFVVADAIRNEHLMVLGEACADMNLITGGSGIAMGLPENFRKSGKLESVDGLSPVNGVEGPAVVLSGSCSLATQEQVRSVPGGWPVMNLDPLTLADGSVTVADIVDWAEASFEKGTPVIYSTADAQSVSAVQEKLGRDAAGELVEKTLAAVARSLAEKGVRKFVVAGGETSGAVMQSLGVDCLRIGPEIDPGVPWTVSEDSRRLLLALKSGNFGAVDFFEKALRMVS